jgi:hypothetical protein
MLIGQSQRQMRRRGRGPTLVKEHSTRTSRSLAMEIIPPIQTFPSRAAGSRPTLASA